jgi:Homeodomain-like domain
MTIRVRERKRLAFSAMIKERGLSHAQAADLLHVSVDTLKSWLKPETSKSSYPVPGWAPELLGYKVPILTNDAGARAALKKIVIRKLTPDEKRARRRILAAAR